MNFVLDAIAGRRSVRAYKPQTVTKDQLDALLKAAVESPSARNLQPWHFTIVQSAAILDEVNQEALKNFSLPPIRDIFYGAPLVIFISADQQNSFGKMDSGIAVQTLSLAAWSLGLGSVILGMPGGAFIGDRKEYFEKLLKFPEGYEFAIAIAIGEAADTKEAHPVEPGKIDFAE